MRTKPSRIGGIAVAVATAAAVVFGTAAPAVAGNIGYELRRGSTLYADDYIQATWPGGKTYWLIMQADGNLVLYKGNMSHSRVDKVCWASNTFSHRPYAVYQNDGNFVIYTPLFGTVLWASNTVGQAGSTVDMDRNGRLWVGLKTISGNC
ncbi:hypothetical protein Ait01nite_034410 [Actinoplanes italicus]|uniref:D-mannose binding lectin n=1 Tax=Actinoplanes italicus TaxID=113567 RepID=A0A2T0K9L7_9ACTN|nr:hypothetical protein [Actinoplanes italicus]PRX19593.1 D-mannose binding lectin [Actinoplanes italicus]GIE30396.1 hypothetical protein Ait01nite_034410 [Actinoplanes italicus]